MFLWLLFERQEVVVLFCFPPNCLILSCCPVTHYVTGCWIQCAKNKNLISAGTACYFSMGRKIAASCKNQRVTCWEVKGRSSSHLPFIVETEVGVSCQLLLWFRPPLHLLCTMLLFLETVPLCCSAAWLGLRKKHVAVMKCWAVNLKPAM